MRRPARALLSAAVLAAALGLLVVAFRSSGSFLVVDNPEKSDVIVVTQGDSLDAPFWIGLRLLADGYGRELFLNAHTDKIFFGRSQADWAAEFMKQTGGGPPLADRLKLCPLTADTTAEETYETARCLKTTGARSVLLVVHDFHSRRSLSIFSRLLPQYRFSLASVADTRLFGVRWWRKRQWVRTAVVEWEHMLWWELIDRWRFAPMTFSNSIENPAQTN